MGEQAVIKYLSQPVWHDVVHARHHHGQEVAVAWSSGMNGGREASKEDAVWGVEKEEVTPWTEEEVERPDFK